MGILQDLLARISLAMRPVRPPPPPSGMPAPLPGPNEAPRLVLAPGARDGGAAAGLAMTLNAYGRATTLAELDAAMPPDELGMRNALQIVEEARQRGLHTSAVKLQLSRQAWMLVPGDIVHVDGNRFVVVQAITDDDVLVLDPERGARALPIERGQQFMVLWFADSDAAMQIRRDRAGMGDPPLPMPRAVARVKRT